MRSPRGFLIGVLLLWLPTAALAQSGNATLSGSVTDATGAVIPCAKVTITNTATGVGRTVETTAAGFYAVPTLIPGPYQITVAAPGFRPTQVTAYIRGTVRSGWIFRLTKGELPARLSKEG